MTTNPIDPIQDALRPLASRRWDNPEQVAQIEDRLMRQYRPARRGWRGTIQRHRVLAAALAASLLAGSAVAYAIIVNRQYDFTVRQGDAILSQPRVLVTPGQNATITITDADGKQTTMNINEDGSVTSESNIDDVTVEYDVTDVDGNIKPATRP